MPLMHADVPFQVFSKVGVVKSCSVSRKKNKAGIPDNTVARKEGSRRTCRFGRGAGYRRSAGPKRRPPSDSQRPA